MSVKIRLQRHGKKGKPFYWIVAADSRSKRDGRYLEKLGTYDPNTNPASINLRVEDTVTWLEKGAQPTDTARTLLSYKGVMIKHHLNGGVRKKALTQEEADKKFTAWIEEKEVKIQTKKDGLSKTESVSKNKRLADEKAVSNKRLADAAKVEADAAKVEADAAKAEADAAKAEADEAKAKADAAKVEADALEAVTEKSEAKVNQEIDDSEVTPAAENSIEDLTAPTNDDVNLVEVDKSLTESSKKVEEAATDENLTSEEKKK